MGLLSGITALFKGGDNVGKALDIAKMGANGIDAMFFTNEEKAEHALEIGKQKLGWGSLALEHVKTSIGESTMRSLSRRYLAWGVFSLGGFLTLYSLFVRTLAVFWLKYAEELKEVAMHSLKLLQIWWPIILAAGVFYFGAHLLGLTGKKREV
jgi:hypothetical protein